MLREAREAHGLHIDVVAAALKVPPQKLEALEADDIDALPDPVFARALAASVCRALRSTRRRCWPSCPARSVPAWRTPTAPSARTFAPGAALGPRHRPSCRRAHCCVVVGLAAGRRGAAVLAAAIGVRRSRRVVLAIDSRHARRPPPPADERLRSAALPARWSSRRPSRRRWRRRPVARGRRACLRPAAAAGAATGAGGVRAAAAASTDLLRRSPRTRRFVGRRDRSRRQAAAARGRSRPAKRSR